MEHMHTQREVHGNSQMHLAKMLPVCSFMAQFVSSRKIKRQQESVLLPCSMEESAC